MKPILSNLIFLLVFFLSFFLRPTPAWAAGQACCPAGSIYTAACSWPIQPGCFAKTGVGNGYNCLDRKANLACSGTELCDLPSNTCIQKTKPPTCGPAPKAIDFRTLDYGNKICQRDEPEIKDKCCKGIQVFTGPFSGGYFCENGNSKGNAINWCGEVPGNAIFVDKTYCGSDGIFGYDKDKGLCVQGFESKWKIYDTCDNNHPGVQTAIGCVPTNDLQGFLEFVLKWAFFASGGIILLMIIATGYMLMTSAGNPEKLQAAKENIVALFSGLILIVFSLILLQVVGADVLKLPTFIP